MIFASTSETRTSSECLLFEGREFGQKCRLLTQEGCPAASWKLGLELLDVLALCHLSPKMCSKISRSWWQMIEHRAEKNEEATLRCVIISFVSTAPQGCGKDPADPAETDGAASNVTLHRSNCGEREERE